MSHLHIACIKQYDFLLGQFVQSQSFSRRLYSIVRQACQLWTMSFCLFSQWLSCWLSSDLHPGVHSNDQVSCSTLTQTQLVLLSELSVPGVFICLIFNCLGHICCKEKQITCGTYCVSSGTMLNVLCGTGAKVAEIGSIRSKWGNTCLATRVTHNSHRDSGVASLVMTTCLGRWVNLIRGNLHSIHMFLVKGLHLAYPKV